MYRNVLELANEIGCCPRDVLNNSANFVDYWEFDNHMFSDFYQVENFLKTDYPVDNWSNVWLRINHKIAEFEAWLQSELNPTPLGWDKVETSVE